MVTTQKLHQYIQNESVTCNYASLPRLVLLLRQTRLNASMGQLIFSTEIKYQLKESSTKITSTKNNSELQFKIVLLVCDLVDYSPGL